MRDQVVKKKPVKAPVVDYAEVRRESLKKDKDVREIIDKMSDTRRWSRPRTRVYDCNYNLGEQYYKPVVDSLDRKYGGGIAERLAADEPLSRRSPFAAESSGGGGGGGGGRSSLMEAADEEFDVGASLQRLKASRAARQELEDELESMSTERMLKKKAATAAAARESLLEGELESALTGGRRRKANYSEQLLDTVGVNGKMHEKLVDEVSTFRRKAQSAIDDFNDELSGRTENSRRLVNLARQRADLLGEEHSVVTVRVKKVPRLTKWTALNATSMTESLEESAAEKAARARARASKARLADLDAEMEALTERGQQREMRVKGLRSLLAETASSATIESSTTQVSSSSVSSASKRERKVNF